MFIGLEVVHKRQVLARKVRFEPDEDFGFRVLCFKLVHFLLLIKNINN